MYQSQADLEQFKTIREESEEYYDMEYGPSEYFKTDDLPKIAKMALEKRGYELNGETPQFEFDIPDDSDMAATFDAETSVIHVHPKILSGFNLSWALSRWLHPHLSAFQLHRYFGDYLQLLKILVDRQAYELTRDNLIEARIRFTEA